MCRVSQVAPPPIRLRPDLTSGARLATITFIAIFTAQPSLVFAQGHVAALESARVSAGGRPVTLKNPLEAGELFLLKATGTVKVGDGMVDGSNVVVSLDGADQNALPEATPERQRWSGDGRPDHAFYRIVDGTGHPLTLHLLSRSGRAGAITVSVFRLSPVASLPPPLETLRVPVLERIVPTALTTRIHALYLLQASGSGHVGGGGLGQGDAEYMDYKADGTGQEDIGDGHTDYGLGVDEADQGRSPRLHKWGAWRPDHRYYMLFTGTGRPLHFFFYDVKGGYGDNSPADTLTVKIFPVP